MTHICPGHFQGPLSKFAFPEEGGKMREGGMKVFELEAT